MLKSTLLAAAASLAFVLPAFAGDVTVSDAYARSAMPGAMSGAIFMTLNNSGTTDDRLVSASSDVAKMVQLHTHIKGSDGVMKMVEVENGFEVPAGGSHALARGGDHVMLMGLKHSLAQGETVTLKLTFEHAGEMTVEVPVDLTR